MGISEGMQYNLSVHTHFKCFYGQMFNIKYKIAPVIEMNSEENG